MNKFIVVHSVSWISDSIGNSSVWSPEADRRIFFHNNLLLAAKVKFKIIKKIYLTQAKRDHSRRKISDFFHISCKDKSTTLHFLSTQSKNFKWILKKSVKFFQRKKNPERKKISSSIKTLLIQNQKNRRNKNFRSFSASISQRATLIVHWITKNRYLCFAWKWKNFSQ